jgi:acetyl esterase/lipase
MLSQNPRATFRMKLFSSTTLVASTIALVFSGKLMATEPMTLRDYMVLNGPAPSEHIGYGTAASQYVELFKPLGSGPFPVVVLVHGGCWVKQYGGIVQMRNVAGALAAQGIAVWNVEYRRVDEAGGGYPGTFQDMIDAMDLLMKSAAEHQLDTKRVVAVGHSAGGHLVQWLAGRARLPTTSPLYRPNPFPMSEVIALGSIGDLRNRVDQRGQVCGIDVTQLTGSPSAARRDIYSDTSPAELMPNGSHTTLINGALDTVSPPETAFAYAERARAVKDTAETIILPNASHYDEVSANSPAFALILPVIQKSLGLQRP